MKANPFKQMIFMKNIISTAIVGGCILTIVIVTIIVNNMQEREQLYLEGAIKSMALISNEKKNMLGELYIKLNNDFEREIKNFELAKANRKNKRGDDIYYGVNGKENVDELINDDYENGVNSITYIKGDATDRGDGESNFNDMMAFLTSAIGSKLDNYDNDKLIEVFTKLFKLTHTFTGTSTELYPCDHGCAWCKYYCGDVRVQGTLNGDTVGFYKCDAYMGEEGKYGLMYDPFVITKESAYSDLREIAADTTKLATAIQYKDIDITYTTNSEGEIVENHSKVTKGARVVTGDDQIFGLMEPEGYCYVCSGGKETFTTTTKKIGGCDPVTVCHCNSAVSKRVKENPDDDGPGEWVDWHMGTNSGTCIDFEVENANCNHEHTDACFDSEGNDICSHTHNKILKDTGYYICKGHDHYACPGHIIVCCFGHTNLNLEIKIMYYKEMIDVIKEII